MKSAANPSAKAASAPATKILPGNSQEVVAKISANKSAAANFLTRAGITNSRGGLSPNYK